MSAGFGCGDGVYLLLAAADARRRTLAGTKEDQWPLGRYSSARGGRLIVNGGTAWPHSAAEAATTGHRAAA
jgi:hypothetical protein